MDSVFCIAVKIGDRVYKAVLDTGAMLSILARRLLKQAKTRKIKTAAIRVGDGKAMHSVGGGGGRCDRVSGRCRDADSRRIAFEFGEFAANSFGLRIHYEFALKFTGLRTRCEVGLPIRRKFRRHRLCRIGDFLDFCLADFSTFFGI